MTTMTYRVCEDLETSLSDLLRTTVPEKVIVVEEAPDYPGELIFQPFENEQDFYSRYCSWISRYLVLNELYNLPTFLNQLQDDGWEVVLGPSTRSILDDLDRWNAPLEIEGYTLHGYQQFALRKAFERPYFFWNWATGAGKAQPLSEPVLTPVGWRTMGDLRPGDWVIGSAGDPVRVVSVHPQGVQPVIRVEMNDRTFVRCNPEHLWNVRKTKNRRRGPSKSDPTRKERIEEVPWKIMTAREIMNNMPEPGKQRWQIPFLDTVQFESDEELPLDPYMLGVLLGDGCFRGNSIHTDREIVEAFGWNPGQQGTERTTVAHVPASIRHVLMDIGVWWQYSFEKHIPDLYLVASATARLAVLQGLLDTDGHAYAAKTGIEFSTTSERLRDQVADLVRGLRGRATISRGRTTSYTNTDGNRIPGRESWRVSIVFPPDVMPFRLSRKAQAYQPPVQRKIPTKIITAVTEEGVCEEQVCIVVDAPDSLYVTRGHNLTHNSFISAVGARELIQQGQIDLVVACTMSESKTDLCRFFTKAGLDAVVNDGPRAKRRTVYAERHQAYVMNYEKLWVDFEEIEQHLVAGADVLFVFDECHRLLSDLTNGATYNNARKAFIKLQRVAGAHTKVWPMSASVVDGNPLKFRDVFSLSDHPNPLGSTAQFCGRYTDSIKTIPLRRGKSTFDLTVFDWSSSRLQEVRHRVGSLTQAVRKTDPGVRELFQGLQTIVEPVQASKAEHQLYDAIIDRAYEDWTREPELDLSPYYTVLRMTAVTPLALRHTEIEVGEQIAADHASLLEKVTNTKLAKLNQQLEAIRESGDKVLVFTHWTTMGLLLLAPDITVPHVVHYGSGQSSKDSQVARDRFWTDPDITCFLTSDAGAHGLNMQVARYCISLEPTYSYDLFMQRNSRIDRADSHLDGLTAYCYVTENSVEERVWQVCNSRRMLSEAVQGTEEKLSYESLTGRPWTPQEAERARQAESNNLQWLIFGDRL